MRTQRGLGNKHNRRTLQWVILRIENHAIQPTTILGENDFYRDLLTRNSQAFIFDISRTKENVLNNVSQEFSLDLILTRRKMGGKVALIIDPSKGYTVLFVNERNRALRQFTAFIRRHPHM